MRNNKGLYMRVNGLEEKLQSPQTLESFLQAKGFDVQKVAVELNGNVIPRATFKDRELSDNDILEIVHFVGGG